MAVLNSQSSRARGEAAGIRVMDYEMSTYRTDFWVNADREYEDAAERIALRRLLPPRGHRLVELGAGFGRLGDEYARYRQVVLFDYSRTMLRQAVELWGHDPRFVFVAGNLYQPPFAPACMDTVVMIRVMHHLEQGLTALRQIDRMLRPGGSSVLEFANKRNLKAITRHALGRQAWSPFSREPVEFVEMNFNFHPDWMRAQLAQTGLVCAESFGVSHFRLPAFKRVAPAAWLARMDAALFRVGGVFPLAPSVILRADRVTDDVDRVPDAAPDADGVSWLRCPTCPDGALANHAPAELRCGTCGRSYHQKHGIWDFKTHAS